jgi:hypothetical protein
MIITHPINATQENVLKAVLKALKIKFEEAEPDAIYDKDFVKKIVDSDSQYKKGQYKSIKTKDLWK